MKGIYTILLLLLSNVFMSSPGMATYDFRRQG